MKKRLIVLIGSLIVVYVFNFFIPRLMPGDPFRYTSGASGVDMETGYSEEQLQQLRQYYGLDKPLAEQFWDTLRANLSGEMGDSIYYKKPVAQVLSERLPWSLFIMFSSLILSAVIGTVLALLVLRRGWGDRLVYPGMAVFGELPAHIVGILLLFVVVAKVSWLPLSGNVTAFESYASSFEWLGDVLIHALTPILAMTIVTAPTFYFTARASFLSVIQKPYILNARAKGLKDGVVRHRYVLLNALPPIVSRFFLSVGGAVGGTILIENVFAYPGLGRVLREAVMYRDYPMIQGVFLLSTVIVLVSLFISDTINGYWNGGKAGA